MATRSIATGDVGTAAFTLVASTVDTINFDTAGVKFELYSDGAAEVWYTLDGSTPAVDGADSYYLPAAPCMKELRDTDVAGNAVLKLISAGTPRCRVQRAS